MKSISQRTIWLTGLPCSGKTTLAKGLKRKLERNHVRTVHLDADDIRRTINSDLGFIEKDRYENVWRVAHIAELLNKNGICVVASFVSPLEDMRDLVRKVISHVSLVYIRCSLGVCEKRDVKGMYRKARRGLLADFTGVSAPFEEPCCC